MDDSRGREEVHGKKTNTSSNGRSTGNRSACDYDFIKSLCLSLLSCSTSLAPITKIRVTGSHWTGHDDDEPRLGRRRLVSLAKVQLSHARERQMLRFVLSPRDISLYR